MKTNAGALLSPPRIDLQPTASGFHSVDILPDRTDEDRVVAAAREKGIEVTGLLRCSMTPPARKGLVLRFGGVTPQAIRRGVKIIKALSAPCDYNSMFFVDN